VLRIPGRRAERRPLGISFEIDALDVPFQIPWLDGAKEHIVKSMLAVPFLFRAANQLWPDLPQATLFNDIAIALFVLDVFLVIIGWPTTSSDESFAETYVEKP
jgi:hypothetical protein